MLISTPITNNNRYQYILFIALCFFFAVRLLIGNNIVKTKLTIIDLIPVIITSIWLCGLLIGFILGNSVQSIFSNFAGMTVYLFYYFLLIEKVTKEWIFRVIYISSLLCIFITSINLLKNMGRLAQISVAPGLYRLTYSEASYVISITVAVLLLSFFANKKDYSYYFNKKEIPFSKSKLIRFIFLLLGIYFVAFGPASKGFLLGFLFILLVLPITYFLRYMLFFRLYKKIFLFILALILCFFTISFSRYKQLTIDIFSLSEISNAVRFEQTKYLLKELSIFGKGLGASLESGYKRDDLGYGFEVTYINLIHKFGILSIFIFFFYFFTIFKSIRNIFHGRELKYSAAALGAMCYLFVAIGNPVLFSPTCSILHCLALYLIRNIYGVEGPNKKWGIKANTNLVRAMHSFT